MDRIKKGDERDGSKGVVVIEGCRLRRRGYEMEKDTILPGGGEDDNIRTNDFECHELRRAVAVLMEDVTVSCNRPLISIGNEMGLRRTPLERTLTN